MKTVGLDISTCTGMALVGDGEDRGKTVHLPKSKGFSRLHLIASNVANTLDVWKPDLVVVEGYGFGNKWTLVTLVEVGTVIRAELFRRKMPWVEVPPTVLKKHTTGKGNAKKEDMAEAVKARWGYVSDSDDIVDAYALAQMGQMGLSEMLKIAGVFSGC